ARQVERGHPALDLHPRGDKALARESDPSTGRDGRKASGPHRGSGPDLAELLALLALLAALESVEDIVDRLRAEVVRCLVMAGMSWPAEYEEMCFPERTFEGQTVILRGFVRCACVDSDGNVSWEDPVQVDLDDGNKSRSRELVRDGDDADVRYDELKEALYVAIGFRDEDPDPHPDDCPEGHERLCFSYIQVTDGNGVITAHIWGARAGS